MIRAFEISNRLLTEPAAAVIYWVETAIGVSDALDTSIALGTPTNAPAIVLAVARWRTDFERSAAARRGSVRIELRDRWVALVHFGHYLEASTYGVVVHAYADASIYDDGRKVAEMTHRGDLGWCDFLRWLQREAPKPPQRLTA